MISRRVRFFWSCAVEELTVELAEARRENAVLREALAVADAQVWSLTELVMGQAETIKKQAGLIEDLSAEVADLK